MNNLKRRHAGDDELLMVLMDAPTRWLVSHGVETSPATTLRQALRKAREYSSHGCFIGRILKQPDDEMVVESMQISRLWKQIDSAS